MCLYPAESAPLQEKEEKCKKSSQQTLAVKTPDQGPTSKSLEITSCLASLLRKMEKYIFRTRCMPMCLRFYTLTGMSSALPDAQLHTSPMNKGAGSWVPASSCAHSTESKNSGRHGNIQPWSSPPDRIWCLLRKYILQRDSGEGSTRRQAQGQHVSHSPRDSQAEADPSTQARRPHH